jgi:hypothetical protein
MRLGWLIFAGISTLGCKDPSSGQPAAHGSAAAPIAPVAKSATPGPTLGSADAVEEDRAWANATVKEINAVAPELADVSCANKQCRATLSAATQDELVAKTDRLQSEDSLRQLDARGVLLSGAPEQKDGAYKVTVYVKFDR